MKITKDQNEAGSVTVRKHCLTLVELLLVIALLGLVSGIVAINIRKAVQQERFNTTVDRIESLLQFSQELMMIHKRDVELNFSFDGKTLQAALNSHPDLPAGINLKEWGLDNLGEADELVFDSGPPSLRFFSKGGEMSQGFLRLNGLDQDIYYYLKGFPAPIYAEKERKTPQIGDGYWLYPEELARLEGDR